MSRPVKAEDVLVSVSEGNRTETLWLINQVTEFVCQDDDGRTVLSWAAQQGWPEVVKAAIHIGSAIDSEDKGGRTPLSYAAEHGRVHVAQILMKSRALPTLFDGNRQTPLLHAAAGGHVAVIRTLFDDPRVSPLDTDKNGYTALHCAAEKGHKDAVELLLEKRAKIDAVNEKGQTPL
ncbi:ankyrin, partial [Colletotrichum eremochloae]